MSAQYTVLEGDALAEFSGRQRGQYDQLVAAFNADENVPAGGGAEVPVKGVNAQSVATGLKGAIKRLELTDSIRVSTNGDRVALVRMQTAE